MEYYNPEDKERLRWASLSVLIYVALLLVLLFTIRFNLEQEEPSIEGLLVQFGQTEVGSGEEELPATDVVSTPPPPQIEQQEEQLLTDNNSQVEIAQKEIESPQTKEVPPVEQPIEQRDTTVVEERVVNQNALFPGRKPQSDASSQGATAATSGNQGAESGGESGAAMGGGEGEDVYFSLKNRSLVGTLPKPHYGANASGRVVVDITVDETGRVKSATYRAQGSTTNNSELVTAAQNAALKARFTPSDNFIQGGTITYIFKMN